MYVCKVLDDANQTCIEWVLQAPTIVEQLAITRPDMVLIGSSITGVLAFILAFVMVAKALKSLQEFIMNQNNVAVVERSKSSKFGQALVVGVVASMPLFAMADIAVMGEAMNTEVEAAKGIIVSLFGIGATVLALFAGYRYMKRGANSAQYLTVKWGHGFLLMALF